VVGLAAPSGRRLAAIVYEFPQSGHDRWGNVEHRRLGWRCCRLVSPDGPKLVFSRPDDTERR
jgi:hypothetical protein